MSGWVHTLGGLFLVTVLQMRPVIVLLLSVKVSNCVVWNGDNVKIMAGFFVLGMTSISIAGNGKVTVQVQHFRQSLGLVHQHPFMTGKLCNILVALKLYWHKIKDTTEVFIYCMA